MRYCFYIFYMSLAICILQYHMPKTVGINHAFAQNERAFEALHQLSLRAHDASKNAPRQQIERQLIRLQRALNSFAIIKGSEYGSIAFAPKWVSRDTDLETKHRFVNQIGIARQNLAHAVTETHTWQSEPNSVERQRLISIILNIIKALNIAESVS